MEKIHSQLRLHGRTLRIVNNPSSHYKDISALSMCDIFVLPSTIVCVSVSPNIVVRKEHCVLDNLHPEQNHRLESFRVRNSYASIVPAIKSMRWSEDVANVSAVTCGLLYGHNFALARDSYSLDIVFQPQYVSLFRRVRDNLGFAFRRGAYVVAHWRRGDQIERCRATKAHESRGLTRDTSVNCASANDLVDTVRKALAADNSSHNGAFESFLPPQIYIATNEQSLSQLKVIKAAGFKILDDGLARGERATLSTVDVFAVEMQLMINAQVFLGWGTTGVRPFIDRARQNSLKTT